MTDSDQNQQTEPSENSAPAVLKVAEGQRGLGAKDRTFSVIVNRPCDDLAVIANAEDPKTKLRIPETGSEHPEDADLIARPPIIYPVALKNKGGEIFSRRGRFYNVRVPYVPRPKDGE